ncbi:type IV pilus assembly protein PilM [Vibrio fluminensis]|uniref:type IV pilus assembly protein PilM n=1 Tax=Vibrio fluminensis TaxID=2783614 RepID=UPI001888135E|nr:type IV pilus assembly protein PilM [Vibrio fluminensis]
MINSLITGVDIGHHSITAVVIKPVKGTFILSAYRELITEDDIFSDNHQLNHQEIVNKLKELRKALPFFSRLVAISVPDDSVISKVLQIDKSLSVQEKEYAIIEGFSHQSPFDIAELYLDYCFLPSVSSNKSGQLVQVYATKRAIVDARRRIFCLAGFKPLLCETYSHGLVRLWQHATKKLACENWILLDLGHSRSLLVRDFSASEPWCKELSVGVRALTEHAEGEVSDRHLDDFTVELVALIERQWQLMPSNERHLIQGIWLTGCGANVPLLAQALQARIRFKLDLKCQLLDPLSLIDDNHHQNRTYSYCAALGSALLGLDWLRRSDAT